MYIIFNLDRFTMQNYSRGSTGIDLVVSFTQAKMPHYVTCGRFGAVKDTLGTC